MNDFLKKRRYRQQWKRLSPEDDAILLMIKGIYTHVGELEYADCIVLHIVEKNSGSIAGEISLRLGESPAMFYLGHIGYHVDVPYRGNHFAQRACVLCRPFLLECGMQSAVITTDDDNIASIRTCEGLGCEWESAVAVPMWCIDKFQISTKKRRYIFFVGDMERTCVNGNTEPLKQEETI